MKIKIVPAAWLIMLSSCLFTSCVWYFKIYHPDPCAQPTRFTLAQKEVAESYINSKRQFSELEKVLGPGCSLRINNSQNKVVRWRSPEVGEIRVLVEGNKIKQSKIK